MQARSCPNLNHTRANAPVRFCPKCGEVVNADKQPVTTCSEGKHAEARRSQSKYCIDCGEQLIKN